MVGTERVFKILSIFIKQEVMGMKRIFAFISVFLLLITLNVVEAGSQDYVPGEIIVKLKNIPNKIGLNPHGIVETGLTSIDTLNSKHEVTSMERVCEKTGPLKKHGLDRIFLLKTSKNADIDNVIGEFERDPNVEYAEPNYIVNIDLVSNDPDFSKLYGLHNTGQTGGIPDADIDAPEAWDIQTGSSDLLIAVIDTGVDYGHEDLSANMWTNPGEIPDNYIDDDENGFIDDYRGWDFYDNDNDPFDDYGHGTHCAGTIGAVGNNGMGVVGVNWNVKILPVKFIGVSGSGTTSGAVSAVNYATLMGADVMSNSWGGGGYSQALEDAIQAANDAGILFVAAAGNYNMDNDIYPYYPANYDVPNVISVAATDHNDQKAGFSNYGATTVHLGAPGSEIYSSVPTGNCLLCEPSGYKYLDGTSMATPHVAGVAGLIKARFPSITSEGIKARILGGTDYIPSLQGITVTAGRLNAYNTFEDDTVPPSAVTDLAVIDTTTDSVTLTWTATGDDGDIGTARYYDLRYSFLPIDNTNWDDAFQAGGEPRPQISGSTETFAVLDLDFDTTYYFAVKVMDNVGNPSGLSNIISATTPTPPTAFKDDMESGVNGWEYERLWHLETHRSYSPTTSWAYNTGEPKYNYEWKKRNKGSLTSPMFDLTTFKTATLVFNEWFETERDNRFDWREVYIGVNGEFTLLNRMWPGDPMRTWLKQSFNISEYAGNQNVQVRFFFDSRDYLNNQYEGWYIDNVHVIGELWEGNNPPLADAGPDQKGLVGEVMTFDGSGSYDNEGPIASYEWDFGDGTTATGEGVTHTYTGYGPFDVTLTVTDTEGLTDTDSTIVHMGDDIVTITKAVHNDGKKQLVVEATSTRGGEAYLFVQYIGVMEYNSKRDLYTYKASHYSNPGTVTVISSLGGSDISEVA